MTAPLRSDRLSDWALAPQSAWEAGKRELVRVFDRAEAAMRFIASSAHHINRNRRYRLRRHEGVTVVPVPVTPRVIETLLTAGWLDDARASDRQEVAEEVAALVDRWSCEWMK
jgi:hypothetical protein